MLYHHIARPIGETPTLFYARDPRHIETLILNYQFEAIRSYGTVEHPQVATWVKEVPDLTQLQELGKGMVPYVVDPGDGGRFHALQVTEDFIVCLNRGSMSAFAGLQRKIPSLRRHDLYKLRIPGMLPNLTFVPEDVAEGIRRYDLGQLQREPTGPRSG
jgi:hypothetical protein